MNKEDTKKTKKPYAKPQVKTEVIQKAELGKVCNGSAQGGRKASGPACDTLLS
ncbi:MAG: hypothetical protein H6624_09755 [Bdellovibrionaceae bacterium]|nr:hypothetical protein [Bdellovibrionales bacterium]MCB9084621.1 hypothetical protein [Pseudobdellovibrionaceae bacterium]